MTSLFQNRCSNLENFLIFLMSLLNCTPVENFTLICVSIAEIQLTELIFLCLCYMPVWTADRSQTDDVVSL